MNPYINKIKWIYYLPDGKSALKYGPIPAFIHTSGRFNYYLKGIYDEKCSNE